MTRNINLNTVRIFAVAAEHGNFQRAADILGLSHGAVSQRIRQLEQDLGLALFERQPRGVRLTPNGEHYRDAANEALAILATAGTSLDRHDGAVVLHMGASFASRWLMPRLDRFATACPDITLATEIHSAPLPRRLGKSEIAIWPASTAKDAPGRHIAQLAPLELLAVCSPQLHWPNTPMDLEAMLSFPLLQDANRRWERLMNAAGLQAKGSLLNFDRSALALDAAAKGHGIAIAPLYMLGDDLASGRLVELWRSKEPSGEYLYISWAEQLRPSTPTSRTVDWIVSEFGLPAPR